MRIFRIILTALLGSVTVLSTCGLIEFALYQVFLSFDYKPYIITFLVIDICSVALLVFALHGFPAAAVAIAAGAFFHSVFYALHWPERHYMFTTGVAIDTILIITTLTAAYVAYASSNTKSHDSTPRETRIAETKGFWSSLDQASKVAIVTSLITALTGIVATTISVLFK